MIITKIKILKLAVLFPLLLFAFVFANLGKTQAATVYQGPCKNEPGHFEISPAYPKDGKTYNCVRDTAAGDWFAHPANEACPFGAPGYQVPGFADKKACLWYDKIQTGGAGAGAGAKTTQSRANLSSDANCKDENLNEDNCAIIGYLVTFINALSALVGVVIVAMIVLGGIQYSSAGDEPQKLSEARKKIINALIALAMFIFTYAFLNYVVPGGVLP